MLSKKFTGCMTGALVGDCFGEPHEWEEVQDPPLQIYFDKLEKPPCIADLLYEYTDDTAMTKSVAESLIQHNSFHAHDMAER